MRMADDERAEGNPPSKVRDEFRPMGDAKESKEAINKCVYSQRAQQGYSAKGAHQGWLLEPPQSLQQLALWPPLAKPDRCPLGIGRLPLQQASRGAETPVRNRAAQEVGQARRSQRTKKQAP